MVEIGNDSGQAPEERFERDYSVGVAGLVSRTFSLWKRRLGSYVLIVGVLSALMAAVSLVVLFAFYGYAAFDLVGLVFSDPLGLILQLYNYTGLGDILLLGILMVLSIVTMLVAAIVGGGAIKFALQDYGNPGTGDVNSALSYGASRAVTLIVAQLLQGLIIAIPILPGLVILVPVVMSIDPLGPIDTSVVMAVFTGGIVFLVGGLITLYLLVRLMPTIAVVVAEEERSALGAVRRAYQITGGAFWHTLGGVIIFGIAVFLVTFVLSLIAIALGLITPALGILGSLFVSLLTSPLYYIFQAVLYRDLESQAKQESADWW